MLRKVSFFSFACGTLLVLSASAYARDEYVITLQGDTFSPAAITVPAKQTIELTVKNAGATAAEFESSDLDREKIVAANSQIVITIGPLDAGTYTYFNDFNRKATGTIIAK